MKFGAGMGGLLAMLLASGAAAQDVDLLGDTSTGSRWQRPATLTTLAWNPEFPDQPIAPRYQSYRITITDPANFAAEMIAGTEFDGFLCVYEGGFDPNDPLTGLVALDDDDGFGARALITTARGDGPFVAGEHTLVVTGGGTRPAELTSGAFRLQLFGAVLGWGVTAVDQIDKLKSIALSSGRQTVRALSEGVSAAIAEGQAHRDLALSTKGAAEAPPSAVYLWVKMANATTRGDARSLNLPMLQIGADWALSNDVVLGFALAGGDFAATSGATRAAGSQGLVQPYIGWTIGDWRGTASLAYGKIDYDEITTAAGTATAKGEMMAGTLRIARDFTLAQGAVLSPVVSVRSGSVHLSETSGSLAGAGVGETLWFTEATLGAEYQMTFGPGRATITLSADHFDSNAPEGLTTGSFDPLGWSGTLGIGYEAALGDGVILSGLISANGLGTDTRTDQGALTLGWRF